MKYIFWFGESLIRDVYEAIVAMEDCNDCILNISKKTIYAFLNGHFSDEKYNELFYTKDLFGKYQYENITDSEINDCLNELVEGGFIFYFEYGIKKKRNYYSLRYDNNSNVGVETFIRRKKKAINSNEEKFCIPFSPSELSKIDEFMFVKCMIECYPLVDFNVNNIITIERIYSWIDSFRAIRKVIQSIDFNDDDLFCFEFKISKYKRNLYLDVVIKNYDYTFIIEFKQKTIKEVCNDSKIINKAKYELSLYENIYFYEIISSYVLCTKEKGKAIKTINNINVLSLDRIIKEIKELHIKMIK